MKKLSFKLLFLLLLFLNTLACGQVIVNADQVSDFQNGYAFIRKGKMWGMIDTTGKQTLDCVIPNAGIDMYIAPILIGNCIYVPKYYDDNGFASFNLYDIKGNVIQKELYGLLESVEPVPIISKYLKNQNKSDEIQYSFLSGGKTIFTKTVLKELDPLSHTINPVFKNGICVLKHYIDPAKPQKSLTIIIDKKGRIIHKLLDRDLMDQFYEGLAVCKGKNNFGELKYGYIDTLNNLAIDFKFSYQPGNFSDGLALVENKENKWGYIDKLGNMVIQCEYDKAYSFSNGTALVCDYSTNNTYIIGKSGNKIKTLTNIINTSKVDVESDVRNRIIIYQDSKTYKFGAISNKGNILVEPKFEEIKHFNSNRAFAILKNKESKEIKGFINLVGEYVIIINYNYNQF